LSKSIIDKITKKLIDIEYYGGYVIPAIVLMIIGTFINFKSVDSGETFGYCLIIFSIGFLVFSFIYLYLKNMITTKKIIALIMISAFLVRLAYSLKHPYTANQHDIETLEGSGHLTYIFGLANYNRLPETNEWQLYNPPLHYFFASVVYKIGNALGFSVDRCFENVQLLSTFWATATVTSAYKLLRLLNFKGLPLILSFSIIAFHPTMTILGGSINNDVSSLFLITCALIYTVKWERFGNINHCVVSGVFLGLAMMTKYSAFYVALAIFVYIMIKSITTNRQTMKCTLAYIVPVVILGFWYQVRNAVLFGQNMVYLNEMGTNSLLHIPNSFISRLFVLPKIELNSIYCSVYSDTNIIHYLAKNSVFGEYSYSSDIVSALLLILNYVLIIFSVIACVSILKNKKTFQRAALMPICITFFAEILFYMIFNFLQPYGCNMDFRIIPITIICGAVFIGSALRKIHISSRNSKLHLTTYIILTVLIIAFCLLSIVLFM